MKYVVLEVILEKKVLGTGYKNLSEVEDVINKQASKGYRLHTFSVLPIPTDGNGKSKDRIQAALVFEKL